MTIALDWTGSATQLVVNGKPAGKPIAGEDFYRALLRIWLGDNRCRTTSRKRCSAAYVFIGHFAVAFAAKRAAPHGVARHLFLACQLVDLALAALPAARLERVAITPGITVFTPLDFVHYPWTHSLVMAAVWAAPWAPVFVRLSGSYVGVRWSALVVLSHWFLDLLVHRPDLPLAPGSDLKVGFGLWNSVAGTLPGRVRAVRGRCRFYLGGTRAADRIGALGDCGR